MADTGERVPIRDLAGKSGFRVWALDEVSMRLKPAEVSRAFATGRKPVFRLTTRLGRSVRATANHKFRTFQDWRRLDELRPGDRIALPRQIPCGTDAKMSRAEAALMGHLIGDGCTLPRHAIQYTTREEDLAHTVAELAVAVFGDRVRPRIRRERQWFQVYLAAAERLTHGKRNPVAEWLDSQGVFGLRSWEKRVPEVLFRQPEGTVAVFLRHLWATDGCVRMRRSRVIYPQIYYASSSERLAQDVQTLLLRLGINAVLRTVSQGDKGRTQFHVWVTSHEAVLAFAEQVGAIGAYKSAELDECHAWTKASAGKPSYDIIPSEVWSCDVAQALQEKGLRPCAVQLRMKQANLGRMISTRNVSRARLSRFEQAIGGDRRLAALAASDVYWDAIVSIEPDGEEDVFDLTVPGPSNFVCGSVICHNSIEQDADTVMLLHRPDRYEPGQHEGIIEVIIGKQRNGPTGEVTLAYLKQFMLYEDYAPGTPFDG
jgi:replicative DNA helicase